MEGKSVKIYTDNQGVPAIIQKGSMKSDLHTLSIEVYNLCSQKNIDLQVQWIPRELNTEADEISREIDCDDWGVSDTFFAFLESLWGPHSVDRFADNFNSKSHRFNSKYWCVNTEQVDAFSVSWQDENNWVVPPIPLVVQAIKHIRLSQALATLVVPYWPSAFFWPMLFSKNSYMASMVVGTKLFRDPRGIFIEGRNRRAIFGTERFTSGVICIRLDGRI